MSAFPLLYPTPVGPEPTATVAARTAPERTLTFPVA
jgi:hypothetical protein